MWGYDTLSTHGWRHSYYAIGAVRFEVSLKSNWQLTLYHSASKPWWYITPADQSLLSYHGQKHAPKRPSYLKMWFQINTDASEIDCSYDLGLGFSVEGPSFDASGTCTQSNTEAVTHVSDSANRNDLSPKNPELNQAQDCSSIAVRSKGDPQSTFIKGGVQLRVRGPRGNPIDRGPDEMWHSSTDWGVFTKMYHDCKAHNSGCPQL